jgi:hypothetical protein
MRRKRWKHNLGNFKCGTTNLGVATPIMNLEVLPNDTIQKTTSLLLRIAPTNLPVMHPMEARVHDFFVPNRITWSSWEDFITGGSDGNDASVIPTVSFTATPANEPLLDYLGVSPKASMTGINALSIRAYNEIINTFYLDQQIAAQRGTDDLDLARIMWEKDPFTTARTSPQLGTAVTIPLAGEADVKWSTFAGTTTADDKWAANTVDAGGADSWWYGNTAGALSGNLPNSSDHNMYADLTTASGITPNELLEYMGLQRYKEARNLFGANYVDWLRYHGVNPSDGRLSRPEYLGGGKATISFSEVVATASTSGDSVSVGDLAGHGIAALKTRTYRKYFEEHGHIISILSIRPKAFYDNALQRKFFRADKEDYFTPELENIGQAELYNKEIYVDHSSPDGVFGYNDKYFDYRYEPSTVCGEFRNGEALEAFTSARSHSSDPSLNETFLTCTPDDRIFQSTTNDQVYFMANHNVVARRLVRKQPKLSMTI